MSKHTPGPWSVKDTYAAPEVIARGRCVAKVLYEGGSEDREVDANARLIAAAPDLLVALTECADELETALRANYEGMLDYPHNREKLERDLEPVYRARAALANAARQEEE